MSLPPANRILVVDREESFAASIEQALQEQQVEVTWAATWEAAAAAIRDGSYRQVFLCGLVPGHLAIELVREARLRSAETMVLFAACGETREIGIPVPAWADGCIAKPVDPKEVLALWQRTQQAASPRDDPPRLLVLDDDELVIESLQDILEPYPFVTGTRSPLEAIELLRAQPYDILLTDLMMPQMHGIELIRAAKSIRPQILVLVLTGYGSKEVALAALREGAFEFLEKPLMPDIVLSAVDRAWLALRRDRENQRLFHALQTKHVELLTKHMELEALAAFADLDPAPLLRLQADGLIVRGNPAAKELVPDGIIEGKQLPDVLPAFAELDLGEVIKQGALSSREVLIGERVYQFILRGVPRLASAHIYGSDITELTMAKEQLSRSQRLEAVGKLAAGVAHDFNNMLTVISFCAKNLLDSDVDPELRLEAEEINKAAEKGARLTRQLLTFSRKEIISPQVIDLNKIVVETHRMLNRTLGENISMHLSLDADLAHVLIDRGQLEQVIINLVVNARDAMRDGGKLIIETSMATLAEGPAESAKADRSRRYVLLAISDTGAGMSREIQEHVFEPFFTTKPAGEGTGMGLSTAYGIVRRADGEIRVHSELGHGTTVKVYLPARDLPEDELQPDDAAPRGGQGEHVLLVEDDEGVRRLTSRLLHENGYHVITASDGREALDLEARIEVDLLLTDVIMPKMSGKELADQMRLRRPGIKVLFISGYPDSAIAHHGILASGVTLVSKPFTKEKLLQKVRELLDAGEQRG